MQATPFENYALAVAETFFGDMGARRSAPLSGIGFVEYNHFVLPPCDLTLFRFDVTI
jgi:hypothetical protein